MRALRWGTLNTPSSCINGQQHALFKLISGTLTEALTLSREQSEHREEGVTHSAGATQSLGLRGSVMQMRT